MEYKKEYEIEYTLSNGEWCHYKFYGNTKAQAISNYCKETGCPKSSIIKATLVK